MNVDEVSRLVAPILTRELKQLRNNGPAALAWSLRITFAAVASYGVGMLLGSQIGALLYARLPASPTIADWQHMWWYPAIAAAFIALLFQLTFRDDSKVGART